MNLVSFWRWLAEAPMEDAVDNIKTEIEDQTHDLNDEEYMQVMEEVVEYCQTLMKAKNEEMKR
jgi:hypothetical protein